MTTTTTPSVLDLANQNGHAVQGDDRRAVSVFDQHGGWLINVGRQLADGFQCSPTQASRSYRADQRKAAERAIAKWLAS